MSKAPDPQAWEEFVKEIKPLKIRKKITRFKEPVIRIREEQIIPLDSFHHQNDSLKIGNLDNIDRKTAERFRRGEFPIEDRLDLHGKTEDAAYQAVSRFILKNHKSGRRCLLIITGKGHHGEDDGIFSTRGLLKEKVPQWLNNDQLRPLILSIVKAQPRDGGDGALYVLLKRRR